MEEKINYSDLTEKLYDFIYADEEDAADEYICLEDLFLSEKFCNIILKAINISSMDEGPNFKKTIGIDKTIKYSEKFLETLSPEYAVKLMKNIDEEILTFPDYKEVSTAVAFLENGKNRIFVPLKHDISDTFILTHEQIHDTVLSVNNFTVAWTYFSETPTMLVELLQADYMIANNFDKREIKQFQKYSLAGYFSRALNLKVAIELIKEIHDNGYISKMTILNIIETLYNYCPNTEYCLFAINKAINDLYTDNEPFYFYDLRYIIGGVLSFYLYEKVRKNPKLIKEFASYNENFSKLDIQGVFESIGLLFEKNTSLDLEKESYERLEQSFEKTLKRIW